LYHFLNPNSVIVPTTYSQPAANNHHTDTFV